MEVVEMDIDADLVAMESRRLVVCSMVLSICLGESETSPSSSIVTSRSCEIERPR